jgi:hypothetical protein
MTDALEYDPDEHTLVVTARLAEDEYGAAVVVARDVAPWFGVWAEAAWKLEEVTE